MAKKGGIISSANLSKMTKNWKKRRVFPRKFQVTENEEKNEEEQKGEIEKYNGMFTESNAESRKKAEEKWPI